MRDRANKKYSFARFNTKSGKNAPSAFEKEDFFPSVSLSLSSRKISYSLFHSRNETSSVVERERAEKITVLWLFPSFRSLSFVVYTGKLAG